MFLSVVQIFDLTRLSESLFFFPPINMSRSGFQTGESGSDACSSLHASAKIQYSIRIWFRLTPSLEHWIPFMRKWRRKRERKSQLRDLLTSNTNIQLLM